MCHDTSLGERSSLENACLKWSNSEGQTENLGFAHTVTSGEAQADLM
jgi:hypothetical protein